MTNMLLEAHEAEALLGLIETALAIHRRHQLFAWMQGGMQRFVPHALAVLGGEHLCVGHMPFMLFNSVPLPKAVADACVDKQSPMLVHAREKWVGSGNTVCWSSLEEAPGAGWARALHDLGYGSLVVSGMRRPCQARWPDSMFIFAQTARLPCTRVERALELLTPTLHAALMRIWATEDSVGMPHVASHAMGGQQPLNLRGGITRREREILHGMRSGKSNEAISRELGISALTVKNHVQKILRKLGAANRTQAVADAMSMNLLS